MSQPAGGETGEGGRRAPDTSHMMGEFCLQREHEVSQNARQHIIRDNAPQEAEKGLCKVRQDPVPAAFGIVVGVEAPGLVCGGGVEVPCGGLV